jgi:hypothetical protein
MYPLRKIPYEGADDICIGIGYVGTVKKVQRPETVLKEKHGVWDPMPELTITSPYVDSNICAMGNPLPESTLTPMP